MTIKIVGVHDYQLISTSNCRQQPLHSKSFFNFLFAILQSPLESLHNLFPSQLLMKGRFSFSSNYQKEKKLQKTADEYPNKLEGEDFSRDLEEGNKEKTKVSRNSRGGD